MIPYGRQSIDEDDISAVVRVLRSDLITQGPEIEEFESGIVAATEARYAVAFSHGTAALHAAAAVAGLGSGDLVITSPLSFVASANCARYVGATAGFVDIDPETLNLDVSKIPRCDALVAVHYAGLPVDLTSAKYLPRIVIEDACHALGARTSEGPVGNCARSQMSVFSFHPVKTITTGEGGAVTTNDQVLADSLRRFRNHGIVRRPESGDWFYEVAGGGFNYRLTGLQAALGSSQLRKLPQHVSRRRELAETYRQKLQGTSVVLPPDAPEGWSHAHHLFPVRVKGRDAVFAAMRRQGIGVQVHYVPIHWHPIFGGPGSVVFPQAEEAYKRLLSIPIFPSLSDQEQVRVVDTLVNCLAETGAAEG